MKSWINDSVVHSLSAIDMFSGPFVQPSYKPMRTVDGYATKDRSKIKKARKQRRKNRKR